MSKELEALEKLNHTICLNNCEKTLKFGIDDDEHIDCKDVYEFVDCYNIIEQALKKLSAYRKIEKELGIGLITLFKALKNGIYGKVGNEIEHILAPHLSWYNREIYIFKIKDYGKTWALTREELEK